MCSDEDRFSFRNFGYYNKPARPPGAAPGNGWCPRPPHVLIDGLAGSEARKRPTRAGNSRGRGPWNLEAAIGGVPRAARLRSVQPGHGNGPYPHVSHVALRSGRRESGHQAGAVDDDVISTVYEDWRRRHGLEEAQPDAEPMCPYNCGRHVYALVAGSLARVQVCRMPGNPNCRLIVQRKAERAAKATRARAQQRSSVGTTAAARSANAGGMGPVEPGGSSDSEGEGGGKYEVERVLNSRQTPGGAEYHVKWVGYDVSEATWEPESSLVGCTEALNAFRR